MHRDTLRRSAAYLDAGRSLRADASGRIERAGSQGNGSVPDRYTLQEFAGVAVLRRPAYPVAEL